MKATDARLDDSSQGEDPIRAELFGIERLEQHHAAILRTDRQGLITIRSDGRRLAVETYQGSLEAIRATTVRE